MPMPPRLGKDPATEVKNFCKHWGVPLASRNDTSGLLQSVLLRVAQERGYQNGYYNCECLGLIHLQIYGGGCLTIARLGRLGVYSSGSSVSSLLRECVGEQRSQQQLSRVFL